MYTGTIPQRNDALPDYVNSGQLKSQFIDDICAWAEKGCLYQNCKTNRDKYQMRAHESYAIII